MQSVHANCTYICMDITMHGHKYQIIIWLSPYNYLIFVLVHCPQGCYNGECVSAGTCNCFEGWTGSNCTEGKHYMCTYKQLLRSYNR